MTDKPIAISKIVLNIGKREVSLTVDEAKQLLDALQALMGRGWVWYPYIYPQWTYTASSSSDNNFGQVTYTVQ